MNKPLLLPILIAVCLVAGAVSFCSAQTKDDKDEKPGRLQPKPVCPEDRLTVHKTLGLVFTRSIGSPSTHLYRRANPEAREVLHRILENDELAQYHASAWAILGYVGDEADLKRLEKSLRNDFRGVLEGYDRRIVPAMFTAVALMVRRKVKGAEELADKMMTPNYWEKAKFRWYAESPPKQPDFVYYTMYRFLLSYARSLDPKMREKIARIRKHFQQLDDERIEPYFNREKSFDPKSLGDLLFSTGHKSRVLENREVRESERMRIHVHFNGDLQNPGPRTPSRQELRAARLQAEVEEQEREKAADDTAAQEPVRRLWQIAEHFWFNADGKLDALILQEDKINNNTLKLLKSAPQLGSLRILSTNNVSDEGLKHLKPLKQLEFLALSHTPKITDEGLKAVGQLQALTKLELYSLGGITDAGLKHLQSLNNLKRLEIKELSINDAGFQHLKSLRNLEFLELRQVGLTDEGLEHIAELQNLKELRISTAPIKGSGLKHLQKLKNLEILRLGGMPLGDEDLEHLQKCRNLKKLSIAAATTIDAPPLYSNNALSRLKKALPDTEITAGRRYRRPRR